MSNANPLNLPENVFNHLEDTNTLKVWKINYTSPWDTKPLENEKELLSSLFGTPSSSRGTFACFIAAHSLSQALKIFEGICDKLELPLTADAVDPICELTSVAFGRSDKREFLTSTPEWADNAFLLGDVSPFMPNWVVQALKNKEKDLELQEPAPSHSQQVTEEILADMEHAGETENPVLPPELAEHQQDPEGSAENSAECFTVKPSDENADPVF